MRFSLNFHSPVLQIITADHYWHWAHNVIMQEIRAQRWYNGEPPYGLRGFIGDRANRILGYGILRQIRSDPRRCSAVKPMDAVIKSCSGFRDVDPEDTRDFCNGWNFEERYYEECSYSEFRHKSAEELQTYSMTGKLGSYSGGGYVLRLNSRQALDVEKLKTLQKKGWIDRHTRAVMLEFSTYNANVNLFTNCLVIAEFNEGGGITPKWRFEPIQLLPFTGAYGYFINFCEILFVIATVLFTLVELWKIKKLKFEYCSSYWNITEVIILMVSYATVGVYFYRYFLTKEVLKKFNESYGNAYIRIDTAAYMDKIYLYMMAVIVFFSVLKLIKLLQFNKKMNVLALTIRGCWDELSVFFIAFAIVFFAFCCLFYYMYITQIEDFARLAPVPLSCCVYIIFLIVSSSGEPC